MSLSVEREQWQCVGSFTRRLFSFCVILLVFAQSNGRQKSVIHGKLGVL